MVFFWKKRRQDTYDLINLRNNNYGLIIIRMGVTTKTVQEERRLLSSEPDSLTGCNNIRFYFTQNLRTAVNQDKLKT